MHQSAQPHLQKYTQAHFQKYTLTHLSDAALLRELAALVAQDRLTTASLLALIAEVDARRLYVPAGYPSMHAYCVEELRLSEDAAGRRIQAARAARRFPALFPALADGRLHLTAVCLLAPHLVPGNVEQLIQAATDRRKADIEMWLALRFPAPEPRVIVRPVASSPSSLEHALAHVGSEPPAAGETKEHALAHADVQTAEPAPERYLVQVTIPRSTHDKLRYVQALLSHAVPSGDIGQVLDRALDALIAQVEKRKFGGSSHRCRTTSPSSDLHRATSRSRYVPAPVRRAVWERDQGQCTFVSANGVRCAARKFLEFDHIDPVARGGRATVEGMRLRCRAHNQLEAERAFGTGFMNDKREEARLAAARRQASAEAESRARAAAVEESRDVVAGLRSLGCRADEARRAAEFTATLHGATLEERMRAALRYLGSRSTRCRTPGNGRCGPAADPVHAPAGTG